MKRLLSLAVLCVFFASVAAPAQTKEILYSNDEFKKLDTFEAHSLAKADRVFGKKEYKRAAAEYDSFILEFPKSKAIAYALLRKGRCLHLAKKRFLAIKEYDEILDYFPNDVKYAAAALYNIGQCHWENGDEEKALKAWANMAKDVDYRKTRLAAKAINQLADNLAKRDQIDRAVKYWEQVAIDFRRVKKAEPDAYYALTQVIPYYIRTQPNEPKFREFYLTVGGLGGTASSVPKESVEDKYYWQRLCVRVRSAPNYTPSGCLVAGHGSFTDLQKELMENYYRYWTSQMQGKYPDWDDFQISLADYQLQQNRDLVKWSQRMDQIFQRGWKDGDFDRVVKWLVIYRRNEAKVNQYYTKINFSRMKFVQIDSLMRAMFDQVGNKQLGLSVFGQIKLTELNDSRRLTLARYMWGKDTKAVETVCAAFTDKDFGRMEALRYYHWSLMTGKGLPLADELRKVPKYANEAVLFKAQMLHAIEKYQDAIASYKQFQPAEPDKNLYPIAACYKSLGRLNQAISQLREVEQFFAPRAPQAALMIADYYNSAGVKKQYVASLFGVMDKYPKSSQSSVAHDALEKLGYRTGGGVKNVDE